MIVFIILYIETNEFNIIYYKLYNVILHTHTHAHTPFSFNKHVTQIKTKQGYK